MIFNILTAYMSHDTQDQLKSRLYSTSLTCLSCPCEISIKSKKI